MSCFIFNLLNIITIFLITFASGASDKEKIQSFQKQCDGQKCCNTRVELIDSRIPVDCSSLDLIKCTENGKYCDWDCNEIRVKQRMNIYKTNQNNKEGKNMQRLPTRNFIQFDPSNGKFIDYFDKDGRIERDVYDNIDPKKLKLDELKKLTTIIERGDCGEIYEFEYNEKDIRNIFFSQMPDVYNSKAPNDKKPEDDNKGEQENDEKGRNRRRLPVHGSDGRIKVTSKSYPYRVNGLITFSSSAGGHSCTGTLIAPNIVLTAGHCVNQGNGGGWYYNFKFYPNVVSSSDVSTSNVVYIKYVSTFKAWANNGDISYDFGWLTLSKSIGSSLGWLGFGYNSLLLPGTSFNTFGYPSDKPYATKWKQYCSHELFWIGSMLSFSCDSAPGQSGSPTYLYFSSSGARIIYGVLHGGNSVYNYYPRITSGKFSTLCDYTFTC